MSEPRLIRLYKNRRLYDCREHAYITYADLVRLLDKGISFQVEDQRTRADCTHRVLVDMLVAATVGAGPGSERLNMTDEGLRLMIRLRETIAPARVAAFLDHTLDTLKSEIQTLEKPAPSLSARAQIA